MARAQQTTTREGQSVSCPSLMTTSACNNMLSNSTFSAEHSRAQRQPGLHPRQAGQAGQAGQAEQAGQPGACASALYTSHMISADEWLWVQKRRKMEEEYKKYLALKQTVEQCDAQHAALAGCIAQIPQLCMTKCAEINNNLKHYSQSQQQALKSYKKCYKSLLNRDNLPNPFNVSDVSDVSDVNDVRQETTETTEITDTMAKAKTEIEEYAHMLRHCNNIVQQMKALLKAAPAQMDAELARIRNNAHNVHNVHNVPIAPVAPIAHKASDRSADLVDAGEEQKSSDSFPFLSHSPQISPNNYFQKPMHRAHSVSDSALVRPGKETKHGVDILEWWSVPIAEQPTDLEKELNKLKLSTSSFVRVHVCRGSVLDFEGEAIVNATNERCVGSQGVDKAISQAGGQTYRDKVLNLLEKQSLLPGTAALVSCGDGADNTLKAKKVILAVGPRYRNNVSKQETDKVLKNAYTACMTEARLHRVKTIGFCLISAGLFRGNANLCSVLEIGCNAIKKNVYCGCEGVYMIAYTPEEQNALLQVARHVFG